MAFQKKDGGEGNLKSKTKAGGTGGLGLLPPPPSGKLPAPPGSSPAGSPAHVPKDNAVAGDSWGEFASANTRLVTYSNDKYSKSYSSECATKTNYFNFFFFQ